MDCRRLLEKLRVVLARHRARELVILSLPPPPSTYATTSRIPRVEFIACE